MLNFLKGLGVAVLSGAVSGATDTLAHGTTNPKGLAAPAISGAVIGLLGYLLKSPLTKTPSDTKSTT